MKENLKFVEFNKFISKDVIRIYFEWWAGNCNMGFWTSDCNGSIIDYHTKSALIKMSEDMGKDYIVFRHHKGNLRGKCSIIQTSLINVYPL